MKQNKKQGEISHLLEWQEINNTIQNNLPPPQNPPKHDNTYVGKNVGKWNC
jgi:hypothetical protein